MAVKRLDFEALQVLVGVAEAGSLAAAAQKLARSQSALSEQIAKLEASCGARLFIRSKRGMAPTASGFRLLAHARTMKAVHDAACRDMEGEDLAGDLRLAVTDYFRPGDIAAMLRRVAIAYPKLRLHVTVTTSARIEDEAPRDAFDIGLSMRILNGDDRPSDGRLVLRREPLAWIGVDAFASAAIDPLPLVALPDSCALNRFIVRRLNEVGTRYRTAHTASGVGGLQAAVAAGLGITCLNASAVPPGLARLAEGEHLPTLPDVEFAFVPPQRREPPLIDECRRMLLRQFT